jgi:hypothetical protein
MTVFERPVASAVVIGVLLVALRSTPFPLPVRSLFIVIALCGVSPLVRLRGGRRRVPEIYALGVLFAIDSMREFTSAVPVLEQTILALQALASIAVFACSPAIGAFRNAASRRSWRSPPTRRCARPACRSPSLSARCGC